MIHYRRVTDTQPVTQPASCRSIYRAYHVARVKIAGLSASAELLVLLIKVQSEVFEHSVIFVFCITVHVSTRAVNERVSRV